MRVIATALILTVAIPSISAAAPPTFYHLTIEGPINHVTVEYIDEALRAASSGASGILVELDTPGGPATQTVIGQLRRYNGRIVTYSQQRRLGPEAGELLKVGQTAGVHPRITFFVPDRKNKTAIARDQPHFIAFFMAVEQFAKRILSDIVYGVLNREMTGHPIPNDLAEKREYFDYRAPSASEFARSLPSRPTLRPYGLSTVQWVRSTLLLPDVVYLCLVVALCLLGCGYYLNERRLLIGGAAFALPALYGLLVLPVNYLAFVVLGLGAFMLLLDVVIPSLGIFTTVGAFLFYAGSVTIFADSALAVSFYLVVAVILGIIVGFTVAWLYYMMFLME